MENSLIDSGETMETITTEKIEEPVKDILREVESQEIAHKEAPVAPVYKKKVYVVEEERFLYKVATFAYSTVYYSRE